MSDADVDRLYDCGDELAQAMGMLNVWRNKFNGSEELFLPLFTAMTSIGSNPKYLSSTPAQGKKFEEYNVTRSSEFQAFEEGFAVGVQDRQKYRTRVEKQVDKTVKCFAALNEE